MLSAVKQLQALRDRFDSRSASQPEFSITFGPGDQYHIGYVTDRASYAAHQGTEGSYREFKALCRQCVPLLQALKVCGLDNGDLLYWARDQVTHERRTLPRSPAYGDGEGTVEILSPLDPHPYRTVAMALTMFLVTVEPPAKDQGGADDKPKTAAPNDGQDTPQRPSKEALALATLADHPDWTDTRIAKEARCSRTTLYTFTKFMAAKAILQEGKNNLPRGNKYPDHDTEAWDNEGDG